MDNRKIIENFWAVGFNGDKAVYANDLGWSETIKQDAQTDYPEAIFRYVVEIVGFNILFYWTKDNNFYTIETEKSPIEVRKIYPNPNWDGVNEYNKAGLGGNPSTSAAGEIIAIFENPMNIWDELCIDSVRIGDVLADSVIIDLD